MSTTLVAPATQLYTVWRIPKRRGGYRVIESPCDDLKKKQKAMLKELQGALKVSPFAYAFTHYKNISIHAQNHVGKKWVACIDLKDHFPSITWEKFERNVLRSPGNLKKGGIFDVNNALARGSKEILKNTCFHDFLDGKGLRLPQGAPTSPFLSNAYLFKLDWLLAWKASEWEIDYSRYADDLVFSGEDKKHIIGMLKMAERILDKDYGLKVNHKKTKAVHSTRRQLVCGVVVNQKINTPRRLRKNLRAELHQAQLKGGELSNETKGRVAFHKMVRENTKTTYSSRDIINQIKLVKKLEAAH